MLPRPENAALFAALVCPGQSATACHPWAPPVHGPHTVMQAMENGGYQCRGVDGTIFATVTADGSVVWSVDPHKGYVLRAAQATPSMFSRMAVAALRGTRYEVSVNAD